MYIIKTDALFTSSDLFIINTPPWVAEPFALSWFQVQVAFLPQCGIFWVTEKGKNKLIIKGV